jgi:MFS family permease
LYHASLTRFRWLVAKNRQEEARKVLVKFHAGGDESSPLVDFEMKEFEENIRIEAQINSQTSYIDLVRTAANRRRTIIAIIVGVFAQWNGVGVVSYYLTLVLNTVGITAVSQQALINGLLQLFNWFAAVLAGALMVDRLGRRTLFLVSTAGMLASYIIWTGLTSYFTRTLNQTAGNAVVAFIFIYYFFYDIAWTPLLQAYPVEIFPYTLRGRGLTVTLASTYGALIVGQFVNPIAMKAIGWQYYIVFCCLLGALFAMVWFLFPETKGHTLEEIAEVFDGKKHSPVDEKVESGSVEHKEESEKT